MGEELRTLSTPLEALRDRIASGEAKVGVIGLGAVGFAVARAAHAAGHPVIGPAIAEGLLARAVAGADNLRLDLPTGKVQYRGGEAAWPA